MKTYTIEKDVPLPASAEDNAVANTLRIMEVGDSFVAENSKSVSGWIYSERKKSGKKFVTRKIGSRGETSDIRVWRTA